MCNWQSDPVLFVCLRLICWEIWNHSVQPFVMKSIGLNHWCIREKSTFLSLLSLLIFFSSINSKIKCHLALTSVEWGCVKCTKISQQICCSCIVFQLLLIIFHYDELIIHTSKSQSHNTHHPFRLQEKKMELVINFFIHFNIVTMTCI